MSLLFFLSQHNHRVHFCSKGYLLCLSQDAQTQSLAFLDHFFENKQYIAPETAFKNRPLTCVRPLFDNLSEEVLANLISQCPSLIYFSSSKLWQLLWPETDLIPRSMTVLSLSLFYDAVTYQHVMFVMFTCVTKGHDG